MNREERIPLFPLEVVLLPHIPLPLHIFEERYKLMIGECLAQGREFGVVYFDGSKVRKVGCTAKITSVIKRYDDGRMDIVTRGEKRFVLKKISDEKPYLEGDVSYFDDEGEEHTEETESAAREGVRLLRRVSRLMRQGLTLDEVPERDLQTLSFVIAGNQGFTLDEKQKLLEMTSTSERLVACVECLKEVLQRMKIGEQVKKIISGNGNLLKGLQG
ncbi:MAG TPA: LON peptidase substrate-binding domain-containing protein [Syntrophobacteria bacterium]|nr:LON peptidase substrate-binding domain-containing protein [Syntrophobacteria bacterium]